MWRLRAAFRGQIPCIHSKNVYFPTRQFQIFRALATSEETLEKNVTCAAPRGWPGLSSWRASGVNESRHWGDKGPQQLLHPEHLSTTHVSTTSLQNTPTYPSLAEYGRQVLLCPDPFMKAELSHQAWTRYHTGTLPIGIAEAPLAPARPDKPFLLPARQIPTIKQTDLPLNIYTLHNLAHVELNAIDLAWDSVVRFSSLNLPEPFYRDFARIADDESRHLGWCLQRLEELGSYYGCMPAHNMLWEGCALSAGDVQARLAIVPMSQEARGLDAGGRLADRLVGWGDNRSAKIVAKIADEEKNHVSVGVAWFQAFCAAQGADPGRVFAETLTELCPDLLWSGYFNHDAREEVGLLREWYDIESGKWPADLVEKAEVARMRIKEQGRLEKEIARNQGNGKDASDGIGLMKAVVGTSNASSADSGTKEKASSSSSKMQMEELRERLFQMLAVEATAAASSSS
jgi:uncharacterized ferritin-like protein (DUF455 family)